ncbi:site-specific integrase [Lysinibacillus irui]|uniref:site-specific integrase n=1 Tax=Lysinibacillus irui TaxID=2998077 RepID=UPI002AD48666|nr:site-specific integrase [Lysinibacillus irui]MEA0564467.1 site-specific integrase [Lysinibacillus irui]
MTSIQTYKKDGKNFYMFQIYVGTDPLTGKRLKTTRRGFNTKKEAQLAAARLQIEIDKGEFRKKSVDTFNDIYKLWIEQYKNTVQESTLVKTKGIFKNHILPSLGDYKIEKITVQVCQKHVNEWFNKLQKFRTTKSYASKVFDYAVILGFITDNPLKRVTMPKNIEQPVDSEEINYYTKEQLIQFLKYLEIEKNFKAYTLFRLLAFSGMRKGEALALTWYDINFKEAEIRINKALSRGEENRLYVKTTKTKSSIRTIKIDMITMDILKEWKKQQQEDCLVLGYNTLQPKQLVFSNECNEYLQPTKTRKWMLQVQKKYDLEKITTHGLRHTHCSLLFEAGVSIKEVQDRLGHSDIQTTMNIYTHVTEKAKEVAAEKFAKYMDF